MPETDAYEFAESNLPQGLMKNQPFSDYQYNYINDINSGIYNNVSQSLVQFDLSSLYNSSKWTNTKSHFIVIPIIRCAEALTNAPAASALTINNYYLTALKNLNTSLVHQIDLQIGGKSVHQLTPFINLYTGVKLLSQLSSDDLELMGQVLGIYDVDNPSSMSYYTIATNENSNPGIANNYVKGSPTPNISSNTLAQGSDQANLALQLKTMQNKCISAGRGLSSITNSNQMGQEFQPTFEIVNGQAVWRDYVVIFMKDILDAMDKIGLVRRLDAILRIYINTGFCRVTYPAASQLTFAGADSTFTDTCPIVVCHNGALPGTTTANNTASLNVGLFVGKPPSYTFNGTSFANVPSSQMGACRYYYNSITIQPSLALDYISSNSAKSVIYDNVLYNTFVGIASGGNFSQLIQSGVSNIKAVVLLPLVAASVTGFSAYKSPFDTCGGASGHPISLTNLQVAVGGVNQLSTSLNFTWENFVQQVSKFNKSSSSEYGIESGLISQQFWNNNRFYIVNVRSTEDDLTTPRNVVISFFNNSAVAIDVLCFVVYEDKLTINVSTGMITK